MSENVVEPERTQTIWRKRVACWIIEVIRSQIHAHERARVHTHTEICNAYCFSTATMVSWTRLHCCLFMLICGIRIVKYEGHLRWVTFLRHLAKNFDSWKFVESTGILQRLSMRRLVADLPLRRPGFDPCSYITRCCAGGGGGCGIYIGTVTI